MFRTLILTAVVALGALPGTALVSRAAEVRWYKVTAPDGFSIEMPGKPEPTTGKTIAVPGGSRTDRKTNLSIDGTIYNVYRVQDPEFGRANEAESRKQMQDSLDLILRRLEASCLGSKELTLDGCPGLEYRIVSGDGTMRHVRTYYLKDRIIVLMVMGPRGGVVAGHDPLPGLLQHDGARSGQDRYPAAVLEITGEALWVCYTHGNDGPTELATKEDPKAKWRRQTNFREVPWSIPPPLQRPPPRAPRSRCTSSWPL